MKINLGIPIVVKIKVQGILDFRELDVILDTGARYTTISWDIAKDIGYDPAISKRRVSVTTANGVIEVPLITVQSISLRELKVDSIEVTCLDIPELAGIKGLLGLSFLGKMRTYIDYKRNILEIEDP